MTVVAFVAVLAIPVVMLAKRSPATVIMVAIWGLFLGMTPMGDPLAGALNDLGAATLGALGGLS